FIENGGLVTFGGYLPSMVSTTISWLLLVDQGGLWKININ
ncbi:18009_t:CDS:2, partial [Dentiscutata erythropus]